MTKKEIDASWSMTKAKSNNQFQTNFKQEAVKRTVIRRLVKMLFNTEPLTTQEQKAILASYTRSTDNEYEKDNERKYNDVKEVKEVIDFTKKEKIENPFDEEPQEKPQEKPQEEPQVNQKTGEVETSVEEKSSKLDIFGYED